MMIELFDGYTIDADRRQFILKEENELGRQERQANL